MIKYLYILPLFLALSLHAQQKSDSLETIEKYNTISKQLTQLRTRNLDSTLELYNEGILLIKKYEVPKLIGSLKYHLAVAYYYRGNYLQSIKYFNDVKNIFAKVSPSKLPAAYNAIGSAYMGLRDYDSALKIYKEGLSYTDTNDIRLYSDGLNNVGVVYHDKTQLDSAYFYFKKAYRLRKQTDYMRGIANSLDNIGLVLSELKNDSAEYYLLKAYDIKKQIGHPASLFLAQRNLANYYNSNQKHQLALKYLKEGEKNAITNDLTKETYEVYEGYSEIYEKLGDYKISNKYLKKFHYLKDSLVNKENTKELGRIEVSLEYKQKKALDDAENGKKIAIEKQKQKSQLIVIIIVIVGAFLIAILLLVIYRKLRITRKQNKIIEHQHEEIQDSISYAKRIQSAILPPSSILTERLGKHFVSYKPKDVVAGDFYWLEQHDNITFFAVADCTGHGVPGAMVSVVCHNALNRAVREFALRDTGQILDKVRELVLITFEMSEEQMKDGMDICLCAWNKADNKLQFSGANNPLYYVKESILEQIKGTKQPIGYSDSPVPFEAHTIDLNDVSAIYLTTDGYADQFGGERNKKFSHKRLRNMLLENSPKPMNEQKSILESEINSWIDKGNDEQIDDICLMGVHIN